MISKKVFRELLASKFSKDTFWLIGGQATVMLTGLLINTLVSFAYGADELGYFNQALSYYMILSTLFAVGLNNSLIKKLSEGTRSSKEENRLFTSNILSTLAFSGVLTFLSILFIKLNPQLISSKELANILPVQFIALPFFSLNKNFAAYYTGKSNQRQFAIQRIIRWVTIGGIISIGAYLNWALQHLVYAFLSAELLIFIINIISLHAHFDFSVKWVNFKENIVFGLQSYVAEIISILNSYLDLIILGYFLSHEELGIYSFLIFFVRTLYVFPGIMMQNLSPMISKLWSSQSLEALKKRIRTVRKVNLLVVSFQLVCLFIVYKILILFLKQEFAESYWYFVLACIGTYVFSLIYWSGSMLIMAGKLNENILRTILVIVLSLTSTILLGYYFQLLGACIAVSLNGIISFLMTREFIKRILGIKLI